MTILYGSGHKMTVNYPDHPHQTDIRRGIATALEYFGESVFDLRYDISVTARYLKVFHQINVHLVTTDQMPFAWAVLLNPSQEDISTAQAYLDKPRSTVRNGAI